jgi:hypothetical protein
LRLKDGFKIEDLEYNKEGVLNTFYLKYNFSEKIKIDYIGTIITDFNENKKNQAVSIEIHIILPKDNLKKFIDYKKVKIYH